MLKEKEDFMKLYDELGWVKVDEIYHYSCLITSGFNKEQAYKLKGLLNELWLKDENDYSISKLSDMLYNVYDEDMFELPTRELLQVMYNND